MCEATSAKVPVPGDAGGLWYCGIQTEFCNESARMFGIPQGFFADFRNFSTSSSAAVTPMRTIAVVSTASITTDASGNTSVATGTSRTMEPSYPSRTGGEITLSGGAIAGVAIAGFCAGLIAFGSIMFFRRRRVGKPKIVQTAIEGRGAGDKPALQDRTHELPENRHHGVELQ